MAGCTCASAAMRTTSSAVKSGEDARFHSAGGIRASCAKASASPSTSSRAFELEIVQDDRCAFFEMARHVAELVQQSEPEIVYAIVPESQLRR